GRSPDLILLYHRLENLNIIVPSVGNVDVSFGVDCKVFRIHELTLVSPLCDEFASWREFHDFGLTIYACLGRCVVNINIVILVHGHMFCYSKLVWSLSNTTEFQDKVAVAVKFLDTASSSVIYYQIAIIVHNDRYGQIELTVTVPLTTPLFYVFA